MIGKQLLKVYQTIEAKKGQMKAAEQLILPLLDQIADATIHPGEPSRTNLIFHLMNESWDR